MSIVLSQNLFVVFFFLSLLTLNLDQVTTYLSSQEKGPAHFNRQKVLGDIIAPLQFSYFLEYSGKLIERQEGN